MTDEERQNQIDFILALQSQFWAAIQKLEETQAQAEGRMNHADHRMDRLERIVKLMIKAGLRARKQMRQQDERFEQRFAVLLESQAHTDRRVDALIDIVREQRNGKP